MLVIGNLFAFGSAFFLFLSSLKKDKKQIIKCQIVDSSFCILSNIFLKGYMGALCTGISLIRNSLFYFNKLNNFISILLIGFIFGFGFFFNTEGFYGLIPIIANIEYTVFICFSKSPILIKFSLFLNCFLWFIYSLIIHAYPSVASNLIIALSALFNCFKDFKNSKKILNNQKEQIN